MVRQGRDGDDVRAGVVLAGGHSTRFGDEDKSVAPLAGTPMIRRVVDRLEPIVDDIVVNCRSEQVPRIEAALEGGPDASFAIDPVDDRGPMAGISTGLRETTASYAAVVACDMPFVDPALVDHLFERADGRDAAVPRLEDRWYQTTQAVYRVDAMIDACERALARDERRIVAPLDDLEFVVVDEEEVRAHAPLEAFENVNTREELAEARERLETARDDE
ncbi:molybdenum cofactor guanylyltransferase [Natrarchaeobius oligotrophus]|uniref:Probable molybdenum cofactor guanylyltransferase n=1 Tax=Natrarchaeobius chitinivorans TaxID=1679083 RepID=A0A3N6MQZ2_NATCH|nr:molybdenum cofactor guanylyltransferase [Natrarchaeobius chitinivorans]RQH00121.1 molybdenum cofactor guanylyltransferase [Natrarchaeobius chitinivorans]